MRSSDFKIKIVDKDSIKIVDYTKLAEQEKAVKSGIELPKKKENKKMGGQNIVEIEFSKEQKIDSFTPDLLKDTKGIVYSEVQRGFANAEDKKTKQFQIDILTRNPLSVAEEEEARIQAEIKYRLAKKLDEIREEVKKEAYDAGYKEGKSHAHEEILAEAKPVLENFNNLVLQFEKCKEEIFKTNEELLIRMLNRILKNVLLKELKEDTDYTRRLALELIDRVGTRENIKIFVNEQQYASAQKLKEDLVKTLGELKNLSIELDPENINGGCRIETEFGEVDARIEVQLNNIAQSLGV